MTLQSISYIRPDVSDQIDFLTVRGIIVQQNMSALVTFNDDHGGSLTVTKLLLL